LEDARRAASVSRRRPGAVRRCIMGGGGVLR
jgi:hypothetical protein